MSTTLYYHKCDDCLTPFSSTERHIDLCDCDGHVTFMGVVQGDKYVKTENRSPCDGRCTHACGPICDCQCGGANHGTGRLVQVVVKEGKVKAINFSEEDMLRAYKYRELRDYAEKLCYSGTLGEFISRDRMDFRKRRELDKIVAMRVYNPRQQALVNFIVKYKK
jgi:hypothetical protein